MSQLVVMVGTVVKSLKGFKLVQGKSNLSITNSPGTFSPGQAGSTLACFPAPLELFKISSFAGKGRRVRTAVRSVLIFLLYPLGGGKDAKFENLNTGTVDLTLF